MIVDNATLELAQALWNYLRLDWPLQRADCIVGLGSYDLRVADRCAELYEDNWAPFIIFSGHLGNWTRQTWERSEADLFAERAIAKGVPPDKIMTESQSTNIGENVRFTRELLRTRGVQVRSVLMVSKPSTERRMFATCQRIWPEMEVRFASPRVDLAEQMLNGIQDGLIHEMVGDIQRIKEYPALGYQIEQDIPASVWTAFEKLKGLGFDKHLMGVD